MSTFDYFIVAWWALNIFLTIAIIGKPRKPIEPLAAAIATLITTGLIVGLLVSRGVFA